MNKFRSYDYVTSTKILVTSRAAGDGTAAECQQRTGIFVVRTPRSTEQCVGAIGLPVPQVKPSRIDPYIIITQADMPRYNAVLYVCY